MAASLLLTQVRFICLKVSQAKEAKPFQAGVPAFADNDVIVHDNTHRVPILAIAFVIATSAFDGVGSPEGWLCARMIALAESCKVL